MRAVALTPSELVGIVGDGLRVAAALKMGDVAPSVSQHGSKETHYQCLTLTAKGPFARSMVLPCQLFAASDEQNRFSPFGKEIMRWADTSRAGGYFREGPIGDIRQMKKAATEPASMVEPTRALRASRSSSMHSRLERAQG